jgi:hypothetical protein
MLILAGRVLHQWQNELDEQTGELLTDMLDIFSKVLVQHLILKNQEL